MNPVLTKTDGSLENNDTTPEIDDFVEEDKRLSIEITDS